MKTHLQMQIYQKVLPYRLQKLSHFPCCHHECLIDWRQAITPCIQAWLEDFFRNGQKSWLTFNLRSTNICSCSKARLKGTCLPNCFSIQKVYDLCVFFALGVFHTHYKKEPRKLSPLKRTAACQLAVSGRRGLERTQKWPLILLTTQKKNVQRQLSMIQAYLVLLGDGKIGEK